MTTTAGARCSCCSSSLLARRRLALPGDAPLRAARARRRRDAAGRPRRHPGQLHVPGLPHRRPGFPLFGGPKDYGVSLSTSPAIGADGRLADGDAEHRLRGLRGRAGRLLLRGSARAARRRGSRRRPAPTTGRCGGSARAATRRLRGRPRPHAHAALGGRADAAGAGPCLRRLRVLRHGAAAGRRTARRRSWSGAAARAGARRAARPSWAARPRPRSCCRAAISGSASGSRSALSRSSGAARRVKVRRARSWSTGPPTPGATTARPARAPCASTVTGRGRQLRGFRAFVPMLCPGVSAGQFTTQIGTAIVRRARSRPTARFVAVVHPGRRHRDQAARAVAAPQGLGRARAALGRELQRQRFVPAQPGGVADRPPGPPGTPSPRLYLADPEPEEPLCRRWSSTA